MNYRHLLISILAGALVMTAVGCKQRSPSRDQIPMLRERLARVQDAIKGRNAAQVDSLLSSQIRNEGQPLDSLYRFIYGADGSFPFYRFSDYEIVYNQDKARIDCLLSDSTGQQTRPVTLTFVLERQRWQLKRWEPRVDSVQATQ